MTMITKEDFEKSPLFRDDIVRSDLDGDELLSLNLVYAADVNDWQTVEKLLSEGADPRMCRIFRKKSALFMALASRRFDIAAKLYEAGDRLDDYCGGDDTSLDGEVIEFLADQMRDGKNYFFDESRSFSEYCRISYFTQIEKEMGSVPAEELNAGFIELIYAAAFRMVSLSEGYFPDPQGIMKKYIVCLEKMVNCGAGFETLDDAFRMVDFLNIRLSVRPVYYKSRKKLTKSLNAAIKMLIAFVKKTSPSQNRLRRIGKR